MVDKLLVLGLVAFALLAVVSVIDTADVELTGEDIAVVAIGGIVIVTIALLLSGELSFGFPIVVFIVLMLVAMVAIQPTLVFDDFGSDAATEPSTGDKAQTAAAGCAAGAATGFTIGVFTPIPIIDEVLFAGVGCGAGALTGWNW